MDNKIKEITEQLKAGVEKIFNSNQYKEYLNFMSKFYNYSFGNTVLIWSQMPEATLVAGYQDWKKKYNRQVRKGEKAIKIMAPILHQIKNENDEVKEEWVSYRSVNVFDISQTDGDPVPTFEVNELADDVKDFQKLFDRLVSFAGIPVEFREIEMGVKGYYQPTEKKIILNVGMSELQTLKTLIHEIAHSILHKKGGSEEKEDQRTMEVQAESVAYSVCSLLGIDVSDYSFAYIATWSSGMELKELTKSMEIVRKTAKDIFDFIKENKKM